MRITEFWRRMDARFGATYARSVAADYRVPALGTTIAQALEDGVEPKEIWRAVCGEFEVPVDLQ
ncbi:DUF3046 domain-containing protein [Jatrophihabitans sp.]|uniref:DUF3046 domain-containing protein n=1 Tax=Jatrophihabitans sp. TaxID=1932789 RepID=UPI0030C6B1A9|nr:signal transduction histidine kinase [Jatrophihabitans sp.]